MLLKLSSKEVIKIAERRMFAKTIIDSDAFLDMPLPTQALYFHLSMRADVEGFVNNPKKIQRMIGAADDDAKMLIAKNFVIPFESGVVVIKHWKIHNYIRHDRLNETAYTEERSQLVLKDNGAYSKVCQSSDGQLPDTCQSDDSIGKVRLGKVRLGKDSIDDSLQSNDDVTDNETTSHNDEIKEIVSYLNERTGSKYRPSTKETKSHINARLNEGFTVEDCKTVIDIKTDEWLGDKKMQKFLRPQTLFGTKFESYLNQLSPSKKEKVEESVVDDKEYKSFMERFKGMYE